jgi:hypothetical protein
MSTLLYVLYENAAECPALWAGMNAAISKPDRPDIPVRHLHFRRDWKVSAIREAPPCWRGASLKTETSIHKEELSRDEIGIL